MNSIVKIFAVLVAICGMLLTPQSSFAERRPSKGEIRREVRRFYEAAEVLRQHHLDTLNFKKIVDRAIGAMASSCDPYSRYLDSDSAESFSRSLEKSHSVERYCDINDTTGYVKVRQFARGAADEISKAISEIGSPSTLILDLCDNAGGIMSEAIATAGLFLDRDKVVVRCRYRGAPEREIKTEEDGLYENIELYILINERSASASEVVASSLQDQGRATIVGQESLGKGLILRPYKLKNNSMMYVATGQYLTPSRKTIQHRYDEPEQGDGGVSPDIIIDSINTLVNENNAVSILDIIDHYFMQSRQDDEK